MENGLGGSTAMGYSNRAYNANAYTNNNAPAAATATVPTANNNESSNINNNNNGNRGTGYPISGNNTNRSRQYYDVNSYSMNIDSSAYDYQSQTPVIGSFAIQPDQQQQQQFLSTLQQQQFPQQQAYAPMINEYYTYATTTAQMVDPWAFNHANILANLSQLPQDLLPSLLPQIQQQQQQQQQQIAGQSVSALATADPTRQQPYQTGQGANDTGYHTIQTPKQQQSQMGLVEHQRSRNPDHIFAVPSLPQHIQAAGSAYNSSANILPPISSLQQAASQSNNNGGINPNSRTAFKPPLNNHQLPNPPLLPLQQQQQQYQQQQQQQQQYINPQIPQLHHPQPQDGYTQNMYYSSMNLQPMMLPPPSPTILSYYTADPTRWMSLLGQQSYQPQAYHYDYPLPPHQLPFNFPMQQLPNLGGHGQYTGGGMGMQKSDPSFAAAAAVAAVAAAAAAASTNTANGGNQNPNGLIGSDQIVMGAGGSSRAGSSLLLTQQFVPPRQQVLPQSASSMVLPPIDQALQQGNMAVAAAAAAMATAQLPQSIIGTGNQQKQQQQMGGMTLYTPQPAIPQFGTPESAIMASAISQQQNDNYYLSTRRASSFTNLTLLQQQQQKQQQQQRLSQQSLTRNDIGPQIYQKQPHSAHIMPLKGQQQQQQQQQRYNGFTSPTNGKQLSTLDRNKATSGFFQNPQSSSSFGQSLQQQQGKIGGGLGTQPYSFGTAGAGVRLQTPNNYGSGSSLGQMHSRQVHHGLLSSNSNSSRMHVGLSAPSRASLIHKARQDMPTLFSGTKSATTAKTMAAISAAISAHLAPASSAAASALSNSGGALRDMAEFVPGTRISRQRALSQQMRDHILQTAHQLYSTNAHDPTLIEMLLCLHTLHPRHLPTLLLLACAYFSSNQPEKSLEYNELILKIDPNYVEAMSNIGTTLRSMGRATEAEGWWWQAVKLRPGYWDAVENLMGVLCNPVQMTKSTETKDGEAEDSAAQEKEHHQQQTKTIGPRYREALQLCEYVDQSLRVGGGSGVGQYEVSEKQLSRLQSLLYSEGNLRFALGDIAGARREYEKAMEVVLGGLRLDDVIMRIASLGAQEGINQMFHQQLNNKQPPVHNLDINNLPLTLLSPPNAIGLLASLFPKSGGVLPGFVALASKGGRAGSSTALQQANQVASNLLLTLAKLHQDHAIVTQPLTIVLPLYYLSLSLVPSPSTCNNLGIILSAIPSPSTPTMVPSVQGGHHPAQAPMGSALAMQYYTHGLTLDSRHPHLYTNLGSLLKDLGYLAEAVRMYERAVECNQNFDVALANLGNAIKDMGRVQESVPWYLRAVQASPNFVEAVCGLANAMAGVCDWRARDGIYTEIAVRWHAITATGDKLAVRIFEVMSRGKRATAKAYREKLLSMINYAPVTQSEGAVDKRRGWMDRVVEIVDQQLSDGQMWGQGILLTKHDGVVRPSNALIWFLESLSQLVPQNSVGPPSALAKAIRNALGLCRKVAGSDELKEEEQVKWAALRQLIRNEGGWAMRLVERVVVLIQRRWYWDVQYQDTRAVAALTNPHGSEYKRPRLPSGLVAPPVPTVLPFHTFTYPLDAHEIRLISHRNALRLSFTTLGGGAPWLPSHVYPPPPPPQPHIRIGYVSSDFNNHPLSHLMQSVFGMHDRDRFRVYCYATTPPDGTVHRQKIEQEADCFVNCAAWSTQRIVEQIVSDKIHVLVNLNGYTKGARNEIFAARPAPVLVAFMGFAGTLGAGWCDYVVTDPIVCPPWTVRCEVRAERARRAARPVARPKTRRRQPEMQERWRTSSWSRREGESLAVKRRADRARRWERELCWDFGEIDPEEFDDDASETRAGGELEMQGKDAAESHERSADGEEWRRGGMATGHFNYVDKAADENQDEAGADRWVYTERMIYMPHTYFVNDHKQGFREDEDLQSLGSSPNALWLAEQDARYKMRKEIFPALDDDVFIFANFNQLYKIDPTLFRMWLEILKRAPRSILWLLRFPAAGEQHLHRVAVEWAGEEVASRVVFTDVAPKHMHIKRGRVADAFLDTPECNAHTTAVDILWSGTPVLTWPRHEHKLCSRVAASVACATGHGQQMVVHSADEYVERAVEWAASASHEYTYEQGRESAILEPDPATGYVKHRIAHGPAMDLRYHLFMNREKSRLFDTHKWTRNLERGIEEAWRQWVSGEDEMGAGDGASSAEESDMEVDGGAWCADDEEALVYPTLPGHQDSKGDASLLEKSDQRKIKWARRIDGEIARSRGSVYAPRGRCIWVRDEEDCAPAHEWLYKMMT